MSYNPVFYAYALVTHTHTYLFVDQGKVDAQVAHYLEENNVLVKPYGEIFNFLSEMRLANPDVSLDRFIHNFDSQTAKILDRSQLYQLCNL